MTERESNPGRAGSPHMQLLRQHLLATSIAVAGLIAAAAWVAIGWFGVHTLFIDRMVDDELPVFAAAADAPLPAERSTPSATAVPEPAAAGTVGTTPPTIGTPAGDPPTPTTATPVEPPTTEPVIAVEATGSFTSLGRYTTVGTASVLGDGSGQRFVRFEDFETSNGPDLRVYLVNSSAPGVTDHIDLGELRGNIGNQNYEIPAGVDLTLYDTVMIWCERFSSGFGEALLGPT